MRIASTFLIVFIAFVSIEAQIVAKRNVTVSDLFEKYLFYEKSVSGLSSMQDGKYYTAVEGDTIIAKYSYKTGQKVKDIVSLTEINNPEIYTIRYYTFSKNEKSVLLYVNRKDIYRRSFTADYFVWSIEKKKLYSVSDSGRQQMATFSPDGKSVAFVRDNNIYISDYEGAVEKKITTDGKRNEIINGLPDWVYEEEFEYNKAYAWSPDGRYLAYCKFDERRVPVFNMTIYKGLAPERKENSLYPENYTYKYPKAGEPNSIVTVHCYDTKTGKTKTIDTGKETDQYIPRIKWSPAGKLIIYRLNRLQNKLEFLSSDPKSGQSKVFYTEVNSRYIDEGNFDNLTFIDGAGRFIYTSERDGYMHIYLYNPDGSIAQQITKGQWDVTDFYGYDYSRKTVYFQSAQPSPMQRSVMATNIDGLGMVKLNKQEGYNSAVFSSDFSYYILSYSNVETPKQTLLYNREGELIRTLESNTELKERLQNTNWSSKQFFSFKTGEGVELNGWMIKPVDFDSTKQYPVLITQYSGPNSQQVIDRFGIGWEQILASKGYVVACVDPRGTGGRGEDFRKVTYLQLGKYETADQIEVAKYLGSLSYIDASRVGIWGWSYGGFMALNCMTRGADYFKVGIAVAPVTNWRYYDNIYTERFMRTPQENPEGYDDNSPINHADKLKGKLLIIHGSADDNVHLQNTMEMSEAFVQANKQFNMFIYNNRNHGIYGGNTRVHLFNMMIDFVEDNL